MVILQKRVVGLTEDGLERFVRRARRAAGLQGAVTVLVADSGAVRGLNRRFRGENKATDVLSFPFDMNLPGTKPRFAGEIIISADIARQNAAALGHSLEAEVKILALHGILHLAGFDHERDNGEMARKESRLRQSLRLPLALIERSAANGSGASSARRKVRGTA